VNKKIIFNDEIDSEELAPSEQVNTRVIMTEPELRILGLYGEVEEIKISQVIGSLIEMSSVLDSESDSKSKNDLPSDLNDESVEKNEESNSLGKPIEFIISTPGGSADDMFALYDIMRVVRDRCDLVTYGIGKVMSAGVLLLAAGTKGKRKIGKNCRVMIHSVVAGSSGSFHSLETEMSEIRHTQNAYIKALSEETSMTYGQLKRMIDKKVNVYLSAEEAVKLGIADVIV
jgi:ATP-dependent Clp endopeptidase proteolytic subunit ClpP